MQMSSTTRDWLEKNGRNYHSQRALRSDLENHLTKKYGMGPVLLFFIKMVLGFLIDKWFRDAQAGSRLPKNLEPRAQTGFTNHVQPMGSTHSGYGQSVPRPV